MFKYYLIHHPPKKATSWKINGWNIIIGVWKIIFLSKWVMAIGAMLIFQGVGFFDSPFLEKLGSTLIFRILVWMDDSSRKNSDFNWGMLREMIKYEHDYGCKEAKWTISGTVHSTR